VTQTTVPAVASFPGAPSPGASFDWRRRAIEYDSFVHDWSQPGRFPTIPTWTTNAGNRNEGGDGAAGTAAIELWAHARFGDAKYLDAAKWSMDYLERSSSSLFYEVLLQLAPYVAARMNAQQNPGVTTDLGLYGGSWVGFLGGSVSATNVPDVLRTDLNALDFHATPSAPTYLHYDPTSGATIR
jgi:hypothetical protein